MDPELGEDERRGEQAAPVIDYHRGYREEETAREHHSAAVRRATGAPSGARKSIPAWRLRLAVEKRRNPKAEPEGPSRRQEPFLP
jgi:hypothetical protein